MLITSLTVTHDYKVGDDMRRYVDSYILPQILTNALSSFEQVIVGKKINARIKEEDLEVREVNNIDPVSTMEAPLSDL